MRGFTLVELVMVVVIIGILAAVVGPRFFNRQVFDQRLYYEEALSAVRYGQKLAVASGCLIQVNLNAAGYSVRQAAACTSGAFTAAVQAPDGQTPYARALPAGISVTGSTFPVVFGSQGQPSTAATATIGTFTINVTATTGLVQ
ncbi:MULTISPECIES: prepilin-type N-terminal cleavage/methylation domain-containing protein [unclassified Pseudomonas]|uniref:prepilin-type N-terminal cleavage/methylation domain-containing protein n=1 Tax=unclassified Pseudomonas TaxID=196821 RepID=UPI002448C07B|nr:MULTISPECIES: prepilin-type N-terminal cleavage/methylation domain-containing protein [unclassified Pseudomonas]MDG9926323.1 prepilin-type N-terminal cleavage/methylation domain-containing protein [Pseudomonas sp. GD04045]MDH0034213.1 prepilin-type N-terminal cleavage/methylation domain-containing protein [Pseudomonas sp. GD04019]